MNEELLIAGILIASFLATGQHFAIQEREVQAQTERGFFENLGKDIDDAGRQYQQGSQDGRQAGVNGDSKDCPKDDTAYCVGFSGGYATGKNSKEVVDEAQARDDGEFVNENNN